LGFEAARKRRIAAEVRRPVFVTIAIVSWSAGLNGAVVSPSG
jgi:hypothetical protein